MDTKTKRRVLFLILMNFSILIASLIYNFMFKEKLIGDCVFLETFSLYCPGCGGSRSLNALLEFNLLRSFIYYPAIPISSAIILYCDARILISTVKGEERIKGIRYQIFLIIPIVIILNFLIRNILLFFGIDLLGNILNPVF